MIKLPLEGMDPLIRALYMDISDEIISCDVLDPYEGCNFIGVISVTDNIDKLCKVYLIDLNALVIIGEPYLGDIHLKQVIFGSTKGLILGTPGVIYLLYPNQRVDYSLLMRGHVDEMNEVRSESVYLDNWEFNRFMYQIRGNESFNQYEFMNYRDYIRSVITKIGLVSRLEDILATSASHYVDSNDPYIESMRRDINNLNIDIHTLSKQYPYDSLRS